jgi:hypothetical protein
MKYYYIVHGAEAAKPLHLVLFRRLNISTTRVSPLLSQIVVFSTRYSLLAKAI